MPKSGHWGCFWPRDLGHIILISWDETWSTFSLCQNLDPFFLWSSAPLDPSVKPPKGPAWLRDFEILGRVLNPEIWQRP
jgi:hypothetical protein